MNEKTIELRRPLPAIGDIEPVTSLTLREPTIGDLVRSTEFGAGNWAKMFTSLISTVAGVPTVRVRQMAVSDFNAAVAYLAPFTDAQRSVPDDMEPDQTEKTIQLGTPIAATTTTPEVTELTLRPPEVDDLIWGAEQSSGMMATNAAVLARVAKLQIAQVHKMSATDYFAAQTILSFFLEGTGAASPPTLATSSPT